MLPYCALEATYSDGANQKFAFMSASWPAAVPRKHSPEPPRSPPLRPCRALWEVPPLHLPPGGGWNRSGKISHWSECASVATAATSREGKSCHAASEDDEDENLEECMFAFPDSRAESASEEESDEADIASLAFHIELIGLEDNETLLTTMQRL